MYRLGVGGMGRKEEEWVGEGGATQVTETYPLVGEQMFLYLGKHPRLLPLCRIQHMLFWHGCIDRRRFN